jgi:hypothetical protein
MRRRWPLDCHLDAGDHDSVTPRSLMRAGWTGWRRELGWVLIALSVVLSCVAGSFYAGATMPYQDPTPEMLAQQAKDVRAAGIQMLIGGTLGLACLVAGIWLIVWGRRLARRAG